MAHQGLLVQGLESRMKVSESQSLNKPLIHPVIPISISFSMFFSILFSIIGDTQFGVQGDLSQVRSQAGELLLRKTEEMLYHSGRHSAASPTAQRIQAGTRCPPSTAGPLSVRASALRSSHVRPSARRAVSHRGTLLESPEASYRKGDDPSLNKAIPKSEVPKPTRE